MANHDGVGRNDAQLKAGHGLFELAELREAEAVVSESSKRKMGFKLLQSSNKLSWTLNNCLCRKF